ncbi:MAG TPA: serine hydrolase domain-containing protein [Acidimicrobiia bacterium]|nr:serine hydrolase domain-containing protein [Acidimicrobiia bacterium]
MSDTPSRDLADLTFLEDPVAAGLDVAKVAALVERAQRDIDEGPLTSCQLALARHGEVLLQVTLGAAPADARFMIFSATKPVVASALCQLIGEGALDPDARVVEYIPEFATNGKDVVTVEQVMLHTSGFPMAPLGPPQWFDRSARLDAFARWRLTSEPGTGYLYHASSAHWVLAELLERIDGADFRDAVRARVLEPLGLTRLQLGVPLEQQADIEPVVPVGAPMDRDELARVLGVPSMPPTEVTAESIVAFNDPQTRALGVPGAGAASDAADLARFYQALLHDPDGVFGADVLADITSRVRTSLPDYVGTPANRTRALIVAGADGRASRRGFGHTVSPAAFGHDGAGGQIAFADPATGLSFAYLTGDHDQHRLREWRRTSGIASRAAACVAGAARDGRAEAPPAGGVG